MTGDYQEQQPDTEEPLRAGIKPFEQGIKREKYGHESTIKSPDILTPMGKISANLVRYDDNAFDIGLDPIVALGINDKGILVEGTDHDFDKKGYYFLFLFVENPPAGPQPAMKFNLWTDNDNEHVLSQERVETVEDHDDPSEIAVDDNEPYHYVAQRWGPEEKSLWVNPSENVLKQINVSVETPREVKQDE